MNPFVADPAWGWWIVLYFFLGGIAAGAYFLATLIEWLGQEADLPLARLGYRLAFPLIGLCGVFLIVDLERPERFWHMMFQSERVHEALAAGWPQGGWELMLTAPILKWWSPMSIGAWALALFGAFSGLSFLATFWNPRPLDWLMGRHPVGFAFRIVGSGLGFFVASYTGVLLSATNQPLWSASNWIAPLFLTSAASTAIAVFLVLGQGVTPQTRARLERADLWALGLELALFLIFLASLGGLLPMVLTFEQGWALVGGTLVAGLLIPLALHFGPEHLGLGRATWAALFALAGGFLLRYGIVMTAPLLLQHMSHQRPEALDASLAQSVIGQSLIALTIILALTLPFLLRWHWQLSSGSTGLVFAASALVVAAVLFYGMQPLSHRLDPVVAAGFRFSPEDQRPVGGGHGASFFNRPAVMVPRSKVIPGE